MHLLKLLYFYHLLNNKKHRGFFRPKYRTLLYFKLKQLYYETSILFFDYWFMLFR